MELLTNLSDGKFVQLADVLFLKGLNSVSQSMRDSGLVKVYPIPEHTGNTREWTEIDLEEYASYKSESDQSSRADVQKGYSKTMTSYRVAKDIGISYEMRTQNKYPEVIQRLTSLGKLPVNRQDLDLSHRISFAASTSYTDKDGRTIDVSTGDGYALAYSGHTLAGSSETYRNILANNPKLSEGALESMERLCVEQTYNQFGEKMAMPFDILWTTDEPTSLNAAAKLLQSRGGVNEAHSGVKNVYSGKYRHVVLPRVATDANGAIDSDKRYYWGIASSEYSTLFLGEWEKPHLKVPKNLNAGEDFSTDDWEFGVRAGYGICSPGAAWFKMSKGDGSA